MISLLRKLMDEGKERLLYAGVVVIAANAGGAWTAIGDVTTTMLWIRGQITAWHIMASIGSPSLVCLVTALLCVTMQVRGPMIGRTWEDDSTGTLARRHQVLVLALGLGALVSVPVFKALTHLPPYMGMLAGLGVIWAVTERLHCGKNEAERRGYSVVTALRKIDTSVILFFLGILLCIAALHSAGILDRMGHWMNTRLGNDNLIALAAYLAGAAAFVLQQAAIARIGSL